MHLIGHRKTTGEKLLDQAADLAERAQAAFNDQVLPQVEAARERLVADLIPAAQERAQEHFASARDTALPAAAAAAATAKARAHDAKVRAQDHLPHRRKESHKVRNTVLVLGAAGLAAAVAKVLGERQRHLPYVPPSPSQAPTSTVKPPPQARHAAGTSAADPGGADPAEALSDAQERPHVATTPDNPAQAEVFETSDGLDETPLVDREP